jgi:BolA family transcriptional regulator, general stress-responsive regulator
MGEVADTIRRKLDAAFSPERLEVVDDSGKHAGHAGARPGGQTHFSVTIVSQAFEGVGRVDRQRRIYDVLSEELRPDGVHALALSAHAPGEAGAAGGSYDPA